MGPALLLAFGLLWLAREYAITPIQIVGRSMLPTFQEGQIAAVHRLAYWLRAPRRGDIVVVKTRHDLMIKRIVGLPGEEIAIVDGTIQINGCPLREDYVRLRDHGNVKAGLLGPDNYLVIGDNRSGTALAVIHADRLLGRVLGRGISRSSSPRWAGAAGT